MIIICEMSKAVGFVMPSDLTPYYQEDRFYNYGDNPAFKKFMKIGSENCRGKKFVDHRTHIINRGVRYLPSYSDSPTLETSTISYKEISTLIPSPEPSSPGLSPHYSSMPPSGSDADSYPSVASVFARSTRPNSSRTLAGSE